jgi:hypothetical protein
MGEEEARLRRMLLQPDKQHIREILLGRIFAAQIECPFPFTCPEDQCMFDTWRGSMPACPEDQSMFDTWHGSMPA